MLTKARDRPQYSRSRYSRCGVDPLSIDNIRSGALHTDGYGRRENQCSNVRHDPVQSGLY